MDLNWEKAHALSFKIDLSVCIICLFISLFGNIIAFRGFYKQTKHTSTSFLFKSLAVADTFVLLTLYPLTLYKFCLFNVFYSRPNQYMYMPVNIWICFSQVAILSSNGVTLLLTITRLIAVCFPLKTSKLCSIVRVRYYLVATITVSIALYLPLLLNSFIGYRLTKLNLYYYL